VIPIRHFLAGFFWALVLLPTLAVTNSDWSLRTWLSEDGLPNNSIAGLAQTPDGYLWIAMPSGLARFDGVHFEEFETTSFAKGYENQRIRALLENQKGELFVGIDPGHVIFSKHGVAEVFTNALPQLTIESLTQDGDGALWISYHGGIVYRIKNSVATKFGEAENLPNESSSCSLACDSKGQIWFSKRFETGVFRDGQFKTLLVLDSSGARIAPARDGGIWIVCDFQLYKFHEGQKLVPCGQLAAGIIHGLTTAIFEDRTGAVWIGTSANGLFHYDGAHFENIQTSDREISSLTEDREGSIWVGTGGGGLNRLRPQPIALENSATGTPFEAVQSICEDTNGTIWATSADGSLVRNFNGAWKTVTDSNFTDTMANCVTADRDGGIWIGTGENKIFHWHDGRVTALDQGSGLEARIVHGLLVSRNGDLWICGESPDSIQFFRDGSFHNVALPVGARHLRTLAQDGDGNIWAGGDRSALLKISNGRVTDETALTANLQKTIRCLYADGDSNLWIGFSAGGLGRLKDGKFTRVDVAQGLYGGAINQILEDDSGSFWFGSDSGIFRVRKRELSDVADGSAPTLWSIHYGRSEELSGVQARYGNCPGALKSPDGRLWIPMRTGLAIVEPKKLREDLQPPHVLVNRVAVDDRSVALYGGAAPAGDLVDLGKSISQLRLPPDFYRLEFEFTALSFGPPENIHFRYQLEGFDSHWRDSGNLRSAIYSRLPSGNYFFHVQGCNSDGIWNNKGALLAFTITPFFWQTWWFQFGTIFLFTVIVIAIVRYVSFRRLRMKLQMLEQQAALDRERARIARDIHDDLGGSLTQVALLGGLALRDAKSPDKLCEHIQQISTATHQVIKSLDEIVWAVNPRNDTLPDLINYLGQFTVEFLRTAGISCHMDLPDHPPRHPVTSETRHHLYLVIKETLNNIARHAHASEVQFCVSVKEKSVSIVIADNGQGFRKGECDAFADGVRNMKQRMEEIGGQFHIESTAGKGTRTEVIFSRHEN
jgi:ligand-binding sensor domain-containing protein/signal transduction histidine kinase